MKQEENLIYGVPWVASKIEVSKIVTYNLRLFSPPAPNFNVDLLFPGAIDVLELGQP